MPRKERPKENRQRYNRAWTEAQKLAILREVEAARTNPHKKRGDVARVLDKYNINWAYVCVWGHRYGFKNPTGDLS